MGTDVSVMLRDAPPETLPLQAYIGRASGFGERGVHETDRECGIAGDSHGRALPPASPPPPCSPPSMDFARNG